MSSNAQVEVTNPLAINVPALFVVKLQDRKNTGERYYVIDYTHLLSLDLGIAVQLLPEVQVLSDSEAEFLVGMYEGRYSIVPDLQHGTGCIRFTAAAYTADNRDAILDAMKRLAKARKEGEQAANDLLALGIKS